MYFSELPDKLRVYILSPLINIFNFLKNTKSISLFNKIKLIFNGFNNIIWKKYEIKFYSKKVYYDNIYNSINLINYSTEVENLATKIDFTKIHNVLDIGANIGLFSFVLKSIYPHLNIYSFEPNADIFPLLKKNSYLFNDWKCFNLGVGKDENNLDFYYIKGKSSQGSIYEQNAKYELSGKLSSQKIQTISLSKRNLSNLTIPLHFDFIKIDAEGYEKVILENIEVKTRYLYFEFTYEENDTFKINNIFSSLEGRFGKYRILNESSNNSRIQEYLIEFEL
jgi:FkbM family methyltransferase